MEKKRIRKKIKRELPPIGTNLWGKFKGALYVAKITSDKSSSAGRAIEYSRKNYSSMTAAAKAITLQPTNGWRFWKIQKNN